MIGETLGSRYKILKLLGEGAMGQVYLAEHIHLGRNEAVKVLQPYVASDPRFISRFRREARATNRVQHKNIVGVYDFGQLPDGRFYLAMEYADGEPLDKILEREGALPVPRVLRVVSQLALALDHAHSHGVVHRNLKPSNLVLVEHKGQEDVLKVLDFGIAKIICPELDADAAQLTSAGQVFGTIEYMAPESLRGEPESRGDIYAIGCIAFELLTGELPFIGEQMELARLHIEVAPALPSERNPDANIPPELDEVVMCCMEKDAARRFQNGGELFSAVTKIAEASIAPAGTRVGVGHGGRPGQGVDQTKQSWGSDTSLATSTSTTMVDGDLLESDGADDLVSREDIDASFREALCELAGALLDHGVRDPRITVCLAKVRALEDDLARFGLEHSMLARREAKTEQITREREGSLRFAIGELQFDRASTRDSVRIDIDFQLEAIEEKLTNLLERSQNHLDEIMEEGITLAASQAQAEDELVIAYGQLERLVNDALPGVEHDLSLAPIVDRYQSIVNIVATLISGGN